MPAALRRIDHDQSGSRSRCTEVGTRQAENVPFFVTTSAAWALGRDSAGARQVNDGLCLARRSHAACAARAAAHQLYPAHAASAPATAAGADPVRAARLGNLYGAISAHRNHGCVDLSQRTRSQVAIIGQRAPMPAVHTIELQSEFRVVATKTVGTTVSHLDQATEAAANRKLSDSLALQQPRARFRRQEIPWLVVSARARGVHGTHRNCA